MQRVFRGGRVFVVVVLAALFTPYFPEKPKYKGRIRSDDVSIQSPMEIVEKCVKIFLRTFGITISKEKKETKIRYDCKTRSYNRFPQRCIRNKQAQKNVTNAELDRIGFRRDFPSRVSNEKSLKKIRRVEKPAISFRFSTSSRNEK